MLPCSFGPSDDVAIARKVVKVAQRRSAAENTTCAEPDSFIGSLLASNVSADPVFRGAVNMFPPLGAVMATMPAVVTWYATRWDGAMRPLIGSVLCGANGTSNATADNAVAMLKKLLLPTGQAFLKTSTGSFLSDLINNDLGFDTNTAGTFITRDNILGAVQFMQLFTSDAADTDVLSLLFSSLDLGGGLLGGGGDDFDNDFTGLDSSTLVQPSPSPSPSPSPKPSPSPSPKPSPSPSTSTYCSGNLVIINGVSSCSTSVVTVYGGRRRQLLSQFMGAVRDSMIGAESSLRRSLLGVDMARGGRRLQQASVATSSNSTNSTTNSTSTNSTAGNSTASVNPVAPANATAVNATANASSPSPKPSPTPSPSPSLNLNDSLYWANMTWNSSGWLNYTAAGSNWEDDSYDSGDDWGIFGVLFSVIDELMSLDSRFSLADLATDMIDVLAAMAKAALDVNAAGGSNDFEKAMAFMTSGEKKAFQDMTANLGKLKPAINEMLQALDQYPDFKPTLASPTLADVVQPNTGAPSKLPATSGVCGAASDDLEQFLTGSLSSDDTFLAGLDTMPFVGNMMQTIPPVMDWWVGAYDKTVGVVMHLALCYDNVTNIPAKEIDLAVAALRDLAWPVMQRFLVTNSGIILKEALLRDYGFNVTDISADFINKDVLLAIVEFLQDNEDYLDYSLEYAPSFAFFGASLLLTLDPRFTIPDLLIDSMVVMYAMADVPVQVLTGSSSGGSSGSSAGRRMIADTTSPLAGVLTLTPQQLAAFKSFSTSVLQVQNQVLATMATAGVTTSAPLPGAAPRLTLAAAPSPSSSSSGLSTGATIGIAVGCAVGGVVLIGAIVIAVVMAKKKKNAAKIGPA
ncbi:hypothetical protein HYH02_001248 [Chlamydomonas schloesseri]|uniref:Uncharacterized protein n=1 Tax=Chlamydomonas schloesseri TaxID=2026947 RepID=A0A835WU06_9CHLO|nr:hypothetical protein HYH02_001248 [Chlamydomonas schloesseri]|eukprot:KAG2454214.1 hypothetical protein HYH02_001248 [Chlamydomonas schloesseri]